MDEGYIYFTLALLAHAHSPPHKPYNYCRGVCAGVGVLSGHGTIVSPVVCVFVCVCAVLLCGVFCVLLVLSGQCKSERFGLKPTLCVWHSR